jgi:hypothetical protein
MSIVGQFPVIVVVRFGSESRRWRLVLRDRRASDVATPSSLDHEQANTMHRERVTECDKG